MLTDATDDRPVVGDTHEEELNVYPFDPGNPCMQCGCPTFTPKYFICGRCMEEDGSPPFRGLYFNIAYIQSRLG